MRTHTRYHYGAVTKRERRPVTSASHVAHDACEVPPEKARPLHTAAAMVVVIKWWGPSE
jgi:hypothetical protein